MVPSNRQRWTVLFSGLVQGVGFRYTAQRELNGLPVTGFVRNLPDGRVEMVIEGDPADLEEAVRAVERAMGGYIRERAITESPGTGEFAGFSIRH